MIPTFLKEKETLTHSTNRKSRKMFFVDKTTKNMAAFLVTSVQNWDSSQKKGLLQQIDTRVKLLSVLAFIILVSFTHSIEIQFFILCFVFIISLLSKVNVWNAYKKNAFITFAFGFLIFIPASLNLFSHGKLLVTILRFEHEHNWYVYHIPAEIGITKEGLLIVFRLCLKIFNSVSLASLLINTTSFEQITKGFKVLRVPDIFILTLTMSYKYIFIFSQTVMETYQALRMRWWERGKQSETEAIIAGRMGYLFRRAWERYEMIYQSMIARGFTGKVNLYYTEKLVTKDYIFSVLSIVIIFIFSYLNFTYARHI
jgi:cobalt/nickel transport system permease protein